MRIKTIKPEQVLYVIALCTTLAFITLAAYYTGHPETSKTDAKSLASKWLAPCTKETCIKFGLENITKKYGTQTAMDALGLYANSPNSLAGDIHERAHYIGYQTAITYGTKGDSFLKCSTQFNYGCMHGFFIRAIEVKPKSMPLYQAADNICSSIESNPSYSINMKYYCYHGVGHAIMVARNYKLTAAISTCDQLKSQIGQTGCWQGVFMENVNGQMNEGVSNGSFSDTDPLAPCDTFADKYQRECYINQAGHLFSYYNWDISKSTLACLNAGAQTSTCLEGIGLSATSSVWQKILLGDQVSGGTESTGWLFCSKFPEGHVESCVTGAVVQILQMDRFDFKRADRFCSLVGSSLQTACYRRIGEYTRLESTNSQNASGYCDQLPSMWQPVCRQGAQA